MNITPEILEKNHKAINHAKKKYQAKIASNKVREWCKCLKDGIKDKDLILFLVNSK